MIRACAVQLAPALGEPLRNAEAVAREIHAAAAEGADLVAFPEAALTGYVFASRGEALESAVSGEGEALRILGQACREAGVWAVCGAIERVEEEERTSLFNTAFLVGPAGVAGRFRKVHTLCLGADRFVRPGPDGFGVHELPFGRIGLHICYDASFPESARVLRLRGAQLLLLPTNWPDLRLKRELIQVRAYENRVNVLAVNRVGEERGVRFEGGSCAAGPDGRLLLEAGSEPGRFPVAFDPDEADATRVVVRAGEYEYDRLADRRPEAYGPITAPVEGREPTGSRLARE